MFFNDDSELEKIAKKTNFAIFAVDSNQKFNLKNAFFLEPIDNKITVDMVRDFSALAMTKNKTDHFFIVKNAELMNENAENAFLKNLEEPKDFCHFILLTKTPSILLPTILSRAQIFYKKRSDILTAPVDVDENAKTLAKKLITARPLDLLSISSEIDKKKDNKRDFALLVVSTAIELLYKSYFATKNQKLLLKLPNLLALYENLSLNGNLKLHLIADML